ncbi:MAG: type II toxin-antitoxin system RelE/ParE family toxin [Verrucomicrobiota bacterium]|jgi:mRNA-degrading endonuclease RelE of RelBE toxin-antitoxin system
MKGWNPRQETFEGAKGAFSGAVKSSLLLTQGGFGCLAFNGLPARFTVEFTGKALRHLEGFRKFDRNIILDGIKAQLPFEPLRETRNRKPLRPNPLADWELRIREHRVFYDVDEHAARVRIVAVGYKEHNKLFIGEEEFEL